MVRPLVLATVLVITATADAAPTPVVTVDLDTDKIESLELLTPDLPWNDQDPGGLIVPPFANKSWFTIGLHAGDIIRYEDGHPITSNPSISEGITVLDIIRDGKPMLVRIVMHGERRRVVSVNDGDVHGLAHRVASAKAPLVTPIRKGAVATGVRIVDNYTFSELSSGDIVRAVDGKPITEQAELVTALENLPVGATTVALDRDGRRLEFVYEREPAVQLAKIAKIDATTYTIPHDLARAIAHDTDMLSANVVVTKDKGSLVLSSVDPTSLLARLGFESGDTIVDLDGNPIDTNVDIELAAMTVMIDARKSKGIVVHVQRKTKKIALTYEVR
ncbi:MAG TPA: hypothetical protein VGO00_04610 [Kofleriaceae bacterium]|nr:hypothetical protein [Kofleriaceae bacterium]